MNNDEQHYQWERAKVEFQAVAACFWKLRQALLGSPRKGLQVWGSLSLDLL